MVRYREAHVDRGTRATPVVEGTLARAERHVDEPAIPSHEPAVDRFEERLRRPSRHEEEVRHGERDPHGAGQAPCHVHRQAVRRDDVEPDRGHDHEAARACVGVARREPLDRGHLGAEVEVVGARAQAGLEHGLGGAGKGTGGVQDDACVGEGAVERGGVRDGRHPVRAAERGAQRCELAGIAAAEHGPPTMLDGVACHQATRVPAGAVEQEGGRHGKRSDAIAHLRVMEPSQRDDRRSFVAETRFSGAIVSCLWPRDLVAPLLPATLRLDPPPSVPRGRHPVVFIFGEHDRSRVFFASLPLETGVRFLEFVIAVPYVLATHGGDLAMFLPRVFSGEPVVTWSGNAHYGYSKRMVPMEWLGDTFVVSDEQGGLLAHANVEAAGPWARAVSSTLPALAEVVALSRSPILGCRSDGSLVWSRFDWDLSDTWCRTVDACVSFDASVGPRLDPGVHHRGDAGCLEVSGMRWRLTWPGVSGR